MTDSASYQRAAPRQKSAASTGKVSADSKRRRGTDWERLAKQSDKDIARAVKADPDAAPVDDAFWSRTPVVRDPGERSVVVHVDADVARWLRKTKDAGARVNELLRKQMEAERRPPARKRKVAR
ncbi:MAG: hypothetical protein AB7O88_15270 [Reyranellaceae bacterium]